MKNQAPQVSFKNSVVGDSISVSSHDFLDILDYISNDGAHIFTLHGLMPLFISYMVTCSFPQNIIKNGEHHHSLRYDITTLG